MRVFVLVNQVREIGFRQTTALLIAALCRRGHDVYLADIGGLSLSHSDSSEKQSKPAILAKAMQLALPNVGCATSREIATFAGNARDSQSARVEIQDQDVMLIRTNPGRDPKRWHQHTAFLELCQVAKAVGIRVINDPARLAFFASKAAIALLPAQYRPEMLVAQELDSVASFVYDSNRECVIKPLLGSRGNNVIRVNALTKNLRQKLEDTFQNQSVVVQHFIESQEPGDKRVVVLDGNVIDHDGHLAGIHRIPAEGDFRANLHAGGSAKRLSLTKKQLEATLCAASLLREAGIELAGIDLVGTKVIEFNVFSTGGLYDANQFADFDFTDPIAKRLIERLDER